MSKGQRLFWLGVASSVAGTAIFEGLIKALSWSGILRASFSSWGVHLYILVVSFCTYMLGWKLANREKQKTAPTVQLSDVQQNVSFYLNSTPIVHVNPGSVCQITQLSFLVTNHLPVKITVRYLKGQISFVNTQVLELLEMLDRTFEAHCNGAIAMNKNLSDSVVTRIREGTGGPTGTLRMYGVASISVGGQDFQIGVNFESEAIVNR